MRDLTTEARPTSWKATTQLINWCVESVHTWGKYSHPTGDQGSQRWRPQLGLGMVCNCLPSVKKTFWGNILPFHSTEVRFVCLCPLQLPLWGSARLSPTRLCQRLSILAPQKTVATQVRPQLLITVKDLLLPQQGIHFGPSTARLSAAGQRKGSTACWKRQGESTAESDSTPRKNARTVPPAVCKNVVKTVTV